MPEPAFVRHISPDDLTDDEWDTLTGDVALKGTSLSIGNYVADVDKILWQVDGARITEHGFAIYLGRPVAASGPGGAAVIITADLMAYLEKHRRSPDLIDLPISRTTIHRLRRALGHNWYEDGERWWLHSMHDLETLTTADFAVKYRVQLAAVTYARLNLLGPRQRPAGWWRDPKTADLLLSPQPRIYVAMMLDICASAVGALRSRLRKERGESMDNEAVRARISAAKVGVPAHSNTKRALLESASRPKSDEWKAGLSERNRSRPRPQSWVDKEWTKEQDAVLGTRHDRDAADVTGRTIAGIRLRRKALKIPAFRDQSG